MTGKTSEGEVNPSISEVLGEELSQALKEMGFNAEELTEDKIIGARTILNLITESPEWYARVNTVNLAIESNQNLIWAANLLGYSDEADKPVSETAGDVDL